LHGGGACMAVQNAEQLWALQKQHVAEGV